MKLRAKLMMFTAAAALTGTAAFAAIDGQLLAQKYLDSGYEYVEVKVGPTQTKVEAIDGTTKVEAIYSNETGALISSEQGTADADEQARTGSEVRNVDGDFEDDNGDDDSNDDGDDDSGEDDNGEDDNGDDDSSDDNGGDDSNDDNGGDDDNSGSGSDDSGSDDSGDDD